MMKCKECGQEVKEEVKTYTEKMFTTQLEIYDLLTRNQHQKVEAYVSRETSHEEDATLTRLVSIMKAVNAELKIHLSNIISRQRGRNC